MSDQLPEEGERYLRRLRGGLSSLASDEREEIVEEVRAHLAGRYAVGRTDVLDAFGSAEDYAAQFVEEHMLTGAVADGSRLALGRALAGGLRTVGEMLLIAAPLFLVQGVCVMLIALAALKVFFFHRFGYFTSANGRMWVGLSDKSTDIDVFGWWTIPMFIVPSVAVLWACQRIMVAVAKRRLARARAGLNARR